jgi:glycosyltransferase involved in cell wall biosynthesis
MRNICMISQSPYPFDPRVRRQAERLARGGFEVDIICLPVKRDKMVEKFGNGITAYRVMRRNPGQESITKYLYITIKFFLLGFFKLQKLHSKRNYKMIQIHNMPDSHVFMAFIQKLKGVPVILDIHDLTPELLTSKWDTKMSRRFKSFVIFFEKLSCSFSDHVITVTEGCRQILTGRSVHPDKITLVLNTASTALFPFYAEREFQKITKGARLLYHGTVAERFGLHIVIDAMPLILKNIPESILIVHGKYDANYKAVLEEKIRELNLENAVLLGGPRTHEELYNIMKTADLEVVPYISNEYMNLSLSTKAFECAAAGLPIVATRLKTLNMTFDDSAVCYTDDNPEDLAAKVISICGDPDKRRNMTLNAYEAVQSISGDIMEERYIQLVERITGLNRIEVNDNPEIFLQRHYDDEIE